LTLKWASEEGFPLAKALALVTSAPARLMGVPAGTLDAGAPADLCIFDPNAWWKVERAALRSQGKNTPFLGLEVPGQVRCTIVAGQVVHDTLTGGKA
jgi:dihydroorotase